MKNVLRSLCLFNFVLTASLFGQSPMQPPFIQPMKLLKPQIPSKITTNPAVPGRLTYQGMLTTSSGTPVADGDYNFTIDLFDVSLGGSSAWSDTLTLPVGQGTFTAILGSGAPLDIVFNKTYYIQVTVTGGPAGLTYPEVLLPRAELTSAPYALGPWAPKDSNIFFSGGNVGIGTSNPVTTLTVNSNGSFVSPTPGILVGMGGEEALREIVVGRNDQNSIALGYYTFPPPPLRMDDAYLITRGLHLFTLGSGGGIDISSGDFLSRAGMIRMDVNNFIGVHIIDSAKVGIGIMSPSNKLSVHGNADVSGRFGIGVTTPTNSLSVNGSADFSGNVGIGTTTPGERLTIGGSMEVGTGAGDYQHVRIGGGNSSGYLYGSYPKYGDGIHLGYNYFADAAGNNNIPNTGGGTSRLSLGYGSISMYTGGPNTEPFILGIFINGFGQVGVGTTSPSQKLSVAGNICYTGSIGACSDVRYKKEITTLSLNLDKVASLRPVSYYWRTDEFPEQNFSAEEQIGLIAQEVETVYPEVVLTDKNGYKSVDYARLTPALIGAIKELRQQIEELKALLNTPNGKSKDDPRSIGGLK